MNEWRLYFFVLPALVLILTFCYYPSISTIYNSFFDWKGGDYKTFNGLQNYSRALHDGILWKSFIPVSIFIVANIFKLIPSIAMAVFVHRVKNPQWKYIYRVLLVVPMIVPGLVTLFIWKFFFNPNVGFLNLVLDDTGLKSLLVRCDQFFGWDVFKASSPIGWLTDPHLIVPSLILWGFPWLGSIGVLIYLAGLESIGTEIYEAAELDGAGPFQKFLHIELPLILTQVRLTVVLLMIGTVQSYGLQFLLLGTGGGAGGAGMVPGLRMFGLAFNDGQFGYACAVGMYLFAFILLLTWINNRYLRIDK